MEYPIYSYTMNGQWKLLQSVHSAEHAGMEGSYVINKKINRTFPISFYCKEKFQVNYVNCLYVGVSYNE